MIDSMWEDLENLREIPESRFDERVFRMTESRFPSSYTLGDLAKEYSIYQEREGYIYLLTTKKVEWTTDLNVEVEDHRPFMVHKTFEEIRRRTEKVWKNHIAEAQKEMEEAMNRLDEWARKNNFIT